MESTQAKPPIRIGLLLALHFGFWLVTGLLNAATVVIEFRRQSNEIPVWEPITWELSSSLTIALLCIPLAWLTLRLSFERGGRLKAFAVHLVGLFVFSLAHTGGMVALRKLVYLINGRTYEFAGGHLMRELTYEFYKDFGLYIVLVLVIEGYRQYRQFQAERLRVSHLSASLAEARLDALKNQLNPHFLFNTLHMISSYMYEDLKVADRMITRLSDLLRQSLDFSARNEISLSEEVAFLQNYVDILRMRFQERLVVGFEVEGAAERAVIPPLILQPLVENAVVHGVAKCAGEAHIHIAAKVVDGMLHLTVGDNGPGLTGTPLREGTGLSNTRKRLAALHGESAEVVLKSGADGGCETHISLPFRVMEAAS